MGTWEQKKNKRVLDRKVRSFDSYCRCKCVDASTEPATNLEKIDEFVIESSTLALNWELVGISQEIGTSPLIPVVIKL